MHIIGLTGSIGMGKSTVAGLFHKNGIPVQDADAQVHVLLSAGGDGVKPVSDNFPNCVVTDKQNPNYGGIDRQKLGKMVFGNPEKLALLESIIHPLVEQKRHDFIAHHKQKGDTMVVLDIPLLLEKNISCDSVCVCYADPVVRDNRVLQRPTMTMEKLSAILAKQMDDKTKKSRADYVIKTDCSIDETEKQVIDIINKIKNT